MLEDIVQRLLAGLSDLEVRELCLAALRQWRTTYPGLDNFSMHGELGPHIVPLLAARKVEPLPSIDVKEVFKDSLDKPWMSGVVEFMVWFARAGLAVPLGAAGYPFRMRLTRAGERLLDQAADHPLLPGSIERTCLRCPDLPADVASLLADARACMDHGLLRPAIVLMGVAFEVAIEAVVDARIGRGASIQQGAADFNAAKRIAAVRAEIDGQFSGGVNKEARFATHAAYDVADALRRRRNDASHTTPTYGFDDRGETEELLVSALRHLPNLWQMR